MRLFIVETTGIEVGGKLLYAIPTPDPIQFSPHPWNCEPMTIQPVYPVLELTTAYHSIDAIPTGTIVPLYSTKLVGILEKFGVKFQLFRVSISHNASKIAEPYYLFQLLDSLNYERIYETRDDGKRYRLPMSERWPENDLSMFRNNEKRNIVIVKENLKISLEQNTTGLSFKYIDDAFKSPK